MPDSLLLVLVLTLVFYLVDDWYEDEIEEARKNEQRKSRSAKRLR